MSNISKPKPQYHNNASKRLPIPPSPPPKPTTGGSKKMTKAEIIFAVITLLTALVSIFFSWVALRATRKIASAQVEQGLRTQINEAETYRSEKIIELQRAQYSDLKQEIISVIRQCAEFAEQRLVNVYNEACGLYLDKKIDCKRFRKNYEREILQIVRDKNYDDYYRGELKEYYQKTLKVYNDWTTNY